MRQFSRVVVAVACLLIPLPVALGREMTRRGEQLARTLDTLDVEHLWLARAYVNWKTGESLARPVTDGKAHTHCSAFVASACLRMDVYILRPPDHSTVLLANAQYEWLEVEGRSQGWEPARDGVEAQALANEGYLVVAAFKEAVPTKSGHVAIVRPSTKDEASIRAEGPQIIQAGMNNHRSTSLKEGFKHHKAAWPAGVRFYAHEVRLD